MKYTGIKAVDDLATIHFCGNIIPHTWYQTIRRESGKPYLTAIVILADIVYWYRPSEIRDEISGHLIGYKKKFSGDLLRRSYQSIADCFGISKREAQSAIVFLEELGIIKRIFRTVHERDMDYYNVLFLELNVESLFNYTFPSGGIMTPEDEKGFGGNENISDYIQEEKIKKTLQSRENTKNVPPPTFKSNTPPQKDEEQISVLEEVHEQKNVKTKFEPEVYPEKLEDPLETLEFSKDVPPPTFKSKRVSLLNVIPPTLKCKTYIEINKEININKSVINPIHLSMNQNQSVDNFDEMDEMKKRQRIMKTVQHQIDYSVFQESIHQEQVDEIVDLITDVYTQKSSEVRINGENKSVNVVRGVFAKLNQFHIEYVLEKIQEYQKQIRNVRNFMLTTLYNATMTMKGHISSVIHAI